MGLDSAGQRARMHACGASRVAAAEGAGELGGVPRAAHLISSCRACPCVLVRPKRDSALATLPPSLSRALSSPSLPPSLRLSLTLTLCLSLPLALLCVRVCAREREEPDRTVSDGAHMAAEELMEAAKASWERNNFADTARLFGVSHAELADVRTGPW